MATRNEQFPPAQLRRPVPACIPRLEHADLCALYAGARTGGDFFEFFHIEGSLIFALLDIAGRRDEAFHIASAVQDLLRARVPVLFRGAARSVAEGLTGLAIAVNGCVLEAAGGVRCCPGFLGGYDMTLGTLTYINAGHVAALVRDHEQVTALEANGLPFGLFSHVTRDAQFFVVQPGAALLLVSKGVVESHVGRREFGLDGVRKILAAAPLLSAHQLCEQVLERTRRTTEKIWGMRTNGEANDRTAVALLRAAAAAGAAAQGSR